MVLYRSRDGAFTHIAIIVQVTTDLAAARFSLRVLSKWGQHGEYIHAEDDINPNLGSPTATTPTELDVRLNIASDYGTFFKAASREPAVRLLVSAMLISGDAREDVLGRIDDLARLDVDPRYQHPYDTAMAILVWATYYTAPLQAHRAASTIEHTPRTWYSRRLADRIINPAPNGTGNDREVPGRPKAPVVDVWPKETSTVYSGPLRLSAGTARFETDGPTSMKVIWAVLCQSSSVDRDSNNMSLFNVLEEVRLPASVPAMTLEPDLTEEALEALGQFQLVILWARSDEGIGEKIRARVRVFPPAAEDPVVTSDLDVDPSEYLRLRQRVNFPGIPASRQQGPVAGTYEFVIDSRLGDHGWKEMARIPLRVAVDS